MILPSAKTRRHLRKAYLDGGGREELVQLLHPGGHERYAESLAGRAVRDASRGRRVARRRSRDAA